MTQRGGATAAKAILTPWRLGRGYGEGVFLPGRGVSLFLIFFPPGGEASDSWFSSHAWRGGRSGSGGGSRGLALERVGADGSGSQSSRRSCGTPGTSGRCQARGLDPAGGRSILPPPTAPGLWLLPAREWSPCPCFFWSALVGTVMGEGGIENPSTIPWAVGRSQSLQPLTLKTRRRVLTSVSLL